MRPSMARIARSGAMSEQTDEAELVERARHGDREAFAALFEAYNAPICTYLARLVADDEVGRDLAQDAFLAAWRALPKVLGELRFRPWLYRIATNAARSHVRRASLVRWLPWAEETSLAASHTSIAGPDAHAGEAEVVKMALAQLAPQCRICLLLQIEGGFSQREIGELLGIAESSVSAYVSRGRGQFRQAHRRLNGDSQPADATEDTAPRTGTPAKGGTLR